VIYSWIGYNGVLRGSDWNVSRGDHEVTRRGVSKNFVDHGDHWSGDVEDDLGTSVLKS
jgi:hypothetical protein